MSPGWAVEKGKTTGGSPILRKISCGISFWATEYAIYVDRKPHPKTRIAACRDPSSAVDYALLVDKGPCKQTRDAACKTPRTAFLYAKYIDKKMTRKTMRAAEKEASSAYRYYVDLNEGWFPERLKAEIEGYMKRGEENKCVEAQPGAFEVELDP